MIVPPPPLIVWQLYPELVDFTGQINAAWSTEPFNVTSWYRTAERNLAVGSPSAYSQHRVGLAVDLVPVSGGMRRLAEHVARSTSLRVVPEDDHVHVQYWRAGQLAELVREGRIWLT